LYVSLIDNISSKIVPLEKWLVIYGANALSLLPTLRSIVFTIITPAKILPMKRRHSQCLSAFPQPQCHFNLYKRAFVRRNLFDDGY